MIGARAGGYFPVSQTLKIFGQNASASGNSTWDKSFQEVSRRKNCEPFFAFPAI